MKRGIYYFTIFLLIALIAFGNSVVADEDSDNSGSSDSQAESDAEAARQQAESDKESAKQQAESDAESERQQKESDTESARQQRESDDKSKEERIREELRERKTEDKLERIEIRQKSEAEKRERLRTLVAQKTGKNIVIDIEIKEEKSEVEIEIDGEEIEFELDSTDRGSIIKAISERTGLTPDEIVRTARIEKEESRDEEIEIEIEEGRAKIKIEVGDIEEEFILTTTDREEVLRIIAERLGTTPERVYEMAQLEFKEKKRVRTDDGLEEIEIEEKTEDGITKRKIKIRNKIAETRLELEEEFENGEIRLKAKLSNGNNQEIKIMPDRASDIALERLRAKNVEIELKEVGNRAVFEARNELEGRLFGLFRAKLQERVEIDSETGEILTQKIPWWAAFVLGQEEVVEEETVITDTVLAGEQPVVADEDLAAI